MCLLWHAKNWINSVPDTAPFDPFCLADQVLQYFPVDEHDAGNTIVDLVDYHQGYIIG